MKKFVLLIIMILNCIFSSTLLASDNYELNTILKNEMKSNDVFREVQQKFNSETATEYGGAYLDEEGNLNVNIVGEGKKVKELFENKDVNFHKVNYTYESLDSLYKLLSDDMLDLNISLVEVDQQNNKVVVYTEDIDNSEGIKKLTKNSSALEVRKKDFVIKPTYDVVNGSEGVSGTQTFTIGVGAIKNGYKGWLVPGHISAAIGDYVKYNGSNIGKVDTKKFSGSVDASFVRRTNSSANLVDYFPTGDFYTDWDTNSYIAGSSVTAYGKQSGKQSGTILNNNVSYVVDVNGTTIKITNAVKADYLAIQGDSGAAVTKYRTGGKRGVLGLQSASSFDQNGTHQFSLYTKIDNIANDLNVSISVN